MLKIKLWVCKASSCNGLRDMAKWRKYLKLAKWCKIPASFSRLYILTKVPQQRGRLSQDLETLDLEDFRHNYVNITGLRLVDHEDPVISDTLYQMQLHQHHTGTRLLNDTKQLIIKVCSSASDHSDTSTKWCLLKFWSHFMPGKSRTECTVVDQSNILFTITCP